MSAQNGVPIEVVVHNGGNQPGRRSDGQGRFRWGLSFFSQRRLVRRKPRVVVDVNVGPGNAMAIANGHLR